MKIICFANAKGGSGKTTSAALLGSGLNARGFNVALLDCDPLFPLYHWGQGAVSDTSVVARTAEHGKLMSEIQRLKSRCDYCLIDLSGTTAHMRALCFALSDLVLVPMQGSAMDARGAAETIGLMQIVAENRRTLINTSVLLTRVNPLVVTNAVKYAINIVHNLSVPLFRTPTIERSAYRDMFTLSADLLRIDQPAISNLSKARLDVACFTEAIVRLTETPNSSTFETPHIAAR
jgi:chromosome partitioning protein